MKVITIGLGAVFVILAFMVVLGSLNFFTDVKQDINLNEKNDNCRQISFDVIDMDYNKSNLTLTLDIKHDKEFSKYPLKGIQLRKEDKSEYKKLIFDNELKFGLNTVEKIKLNLTEDEFYISALNCPPEFEKKCSVSKKVCK